MKSVKKLCLLGLFALFLTLPSSASAVEGNRYLVKTGSQFWKNAFNARHEFSQGFTADLNDWQVRFAKLLGVGIEPVNVLQILPEESTVKSKAVTGKAARILPSDQTPWGVEYVYKDNSLTRTSGGEGI